MARPDAAGHLVGLHREKFESLATLVLNAGMATAGLVGEFDMRQFDKVVDVNLRAPFALLQEALPLLRQWAAVEPQRGAKVIALSSITGVFTEPGLAAYGSTKAALSHLIDAVNLEQSGHGVSGTAIEPGYVDTDMTAGMHTIAPTTMIKVGDSAAVIQRSGSLNRAESGGHRRPTRLNRLSTSSSGPAHPKAPSASRRRTHQKASAHRQHHRA